MSLRGPGAAVSASSGPLTGDVRPASSQPAASALTADRLYRFFRTGEEETLALRGVSLAVAPGETVAVVGPSGCGKSTLLGCLAGLDEPDGGTVRVGGQRLSHRPEAERARLRAQRIGVLLQSRNLLPHLNVRANIELARTAGNAGPRLRGTTQRPSTPVGVTELLERVGLSARAQAYASELSGGELARAGLAVALANDPDIVLADEPTGELDGDSEQQVLQLLRDRAGAGAALLVVTHSTRVVAIADRVIHLHDGMVTS
ncbi:ABC transporter ATP-binding protein [Terrabacter sp. BE26]|uniref:ABC transporter ATP-binding protein n=1 Tax=Terrabacter sp. BE26 TaxID=2898152 RepID=UPI0035BE9A35